jgi:hypothetical protein
MVDPMEEEVQSAEHAVGGHIRIHVEEETVKTIF